MEPFDKQITDRLKAFEPSYEEGAWENFEQFRKRKKKKVLVVVWRMAAGIAVISLLGWGLWRMKTIAPIQADIPKQQLIDKKVNMISREGKTIDRNKDITPQRISIYRGDSNRTNHYEKSKKVMIPPDKNNEVSELEDGSNVKHGLLIARAVRSLLVRPKILFIAPYYIKEPDVKQENTKRERRLSVAVISSANQAENVMPQPNLGVQGTTEMPIGKNMEISTGLSIGHENLNLHLINDPFIGMPQLNRANYKWVNVEVPFNLRYHFLKYKALGMSLQAGISLIGAVGQSSKLFYENRRTVVTTSVGSNGEIEAVTTTITEKVIKEDISDIQKLNLGTSFSLMLGTHYQLGKNQLAVEPFFKYPFGSLTAAKLNYSTFGVQLRYTVRTNKE